MKAFFLFIFVILNFFAFNSAVAAKGSQKSTKMNSKIKSFKSKNIKPTKICNGCDTLKLGETVGDYCVNYTKTYAAEKICLENKPALQNILACYSFTSSLEAEFVCLKNKLKVHDVNLCAINSTDEANELLCLMGLPEISVQKFGDCFTGTQDLNAENACFLDVLKQKFKTEDEIILELKKLQEFMQDEAIAESKGIDI